LDELRKEYRRLAFLYHPDKGGETAIMQVINDQYDRLSKKLINGNTDFPEARKDYEQKVLEEMHDAWGSEKVESKYTNQNNFIH